MIKIHLETSSHASINFIVLAIGLTKSPKQATRQDMQPWHHETQSHGEDYCGRTFALKGAEMP